MAESHVVSALRAKRDELAGIITALERQIAQARADLTHVDATLRLFAPDLTPDTIKPKAVRHRDGVFHMGELPRLILDYLRHSPEPARITDIAALEKRRARLRADLRHIDGALAQIIGHAQRQEWLPGLPRPLGPMPRPARIDRWFNGQE
ncbi:MAG TPA: hypothetical protein VEB64_11965, partial [Azospirillaceae bacterium]|nr:hypothetical protein [Azospirillaceae bacterium]